MIWNARHLLPSLSGAWRLHRSIEDIGSSAPIATLKGTARFTVEEPDEAAYLEQGLLCFADGQSVEASRAYYYRQEENGLGIFFDEERLRLFHRLVPHEDADGGLVASDFHLCAADRYEGLYRFRSDGRFSIEHVVRGPRKSYRSTTLYQRG